MSQTIRAVYADGVLHLLEPVTLVDGEEIELVILSETERVQRALEGLLAQPGAARKDDIDEAALQRELDRVHLTPPLSETILDERRNSP